MEDDIAESEKYRNVEGMALARAIESTWLKTRDRSFADIAREYKVVEAEFVARAGDDACFALETKRRSAEQIFKAGLESPEPFDTCQELWNDLLRLGFTNLERRCMMSWFYADGCLRYKQPEAGLSVLEPLIAELERWLAELTAGKSSPS